MQHLGVQEDKADLETFPVFQIQLILNKVEWKTTMKDIKLHSSDHLIVSHTFSVKDYWGVSLPIYCL